MNRSAILSGLMIVCSVTASAQDLALNDRPRFLLASPGRERAVEFDAARAPLIQRRVTLHIEHGTLAAALASISRQTGIRFVYSRDVLDANAPARIKVEDITVAAALTEILLGAGVDVMMAESDRLILIPRKPEQPPLAGGVGGRVSDAKTGEGLTSVDVSLEGTRWRTVTGRDGRYRLTDVTPGSYRLLVRRIGYARDVRAVTITDRQETTVDVALQAAPATLKEIVVTAQKREELLQDVPQSIAVVTNSDIQKRGLVSSADYLRGIPGVSQVGGDAVYGGQTIVIRGIATELHSPNASYGPTTATYFGETATTSSAGVLGSSLDIKLVDIERVEVLRGPQGTAFGSASVGGAVRTIPVAPKLDRIEGNATASYSETARLGSGNYNFHVVGNIPIVKDKLAVRAVGYRYGESGFYRNRAATDSTFNANVLVPFGGQTFALNENNVGATWFTGGRVAALFQPTNAFRLTVSYLGQKTNSDGHGYQNSGYYEQATLQVAPEHEIRGQTVWDTKVDLANAVAEYDLGWGTLLGSYSYVKGQTIGNSAWTAYNIPWPISDFLSPMWNKGQIGEVRLATHLKGQLNFLAGLYAEKNEDLFHANGVWLGDPAANFLAPGVRDIYDSFDRRNDNDQAAFGEVYWRFLPRWTLTGGARAYHYDRSARYDATGVYWPTGSLSTSDSTKASGTTFRANLSFKPTDNSLLYAGWSQGFRAGRPQLATSGTLNVCDQNGDGTVDGTNVTLDETRRTHSDAVDNYEVGAKVTLFNRVSIDAALFRTDWADIPVLLAFGGSGVCKDFLYNKNVGAARSEGIELQANVQVTSRLRVDFGGSWLNPRLTQDTPADGFSAGARLPGSPKLNGNLGAEWEFPIRGHEFAIRVDGTYLGSFYSNVQQTPQTKTDAYGTLNASARTSFRGLTVDLYAHNLTNGDNFTFRPWFGFIEQYPQWGYRMRPRTVGIQFSEDFRIR